MRLELYDEVALLFHSKEKDIFLVQHMIKNIFYIKKVIYHHQDLQVYELLYRHPHMNLANVIDYAFSHKNTIVIEEFVNGCTLEYQMSQRPLQASEVEWILLQLFSVVAHLHHQHSPILHRDIKPDNILIYQHHITLIDFEIAKLYDALEADDLRHGSVGYAAPEQYMGNSNPQSDVYAIGVLLQELIFASEQRFHLHRLLRTVIEKSTQLDIHKRYQTIEEMKYDFLQCFHHQRG